jgi:hypothetical protein
VLTIVAYPQKCLPSPTIQLLGKPNQATPDNFSNRQIVTVCHGANGTW